MQFRYLTPTPGAYSQTFEHHNNMALPTELLEEILQLCDQQTLRCALQCNSQLWAIGVRLLYRTVAPVMARAQDHKDFGAALCSNALFARHTRRLDLSSHCGDWFAGVNDIKGLQQLALSHDSIQEPPPDVVFPLLRGLSGGSPGFAARHHGLETLNLEEVDLRIGVGSGQPLKYFELPVRAALVMLALPFAPNSRWVDSRDGILAVRTSDYDREHLEELPRDAAELIETLKSTRRDVPPALALGYDVANAIASLPPINVVSNPRITKLCVQVSYAKGSMRKFLPRLLAHFPHVRILALTNDPLRPVSVPGQIWKDLSRTLGVQIIPPAPEEQLQRVCIHGRTQCIPDCAPFDARLGFAVRFVGNLHKAV